MELTHTISAIELVWLGLALFGVAMRIRALHDALVDRALAAVLPDVGETTLVLAEATVWGEVLGLLVKIFFAIAGAAAMTIPTNQAPTGGAINAIVGVCLICALVLLDYRSVALARTRQRLLDLELRNRERGEG